MNDDLKEKLEKIDRENIFQTYLIMFKTDNLFVFFDLLGDMGEYMVTFKNSGLDKFVCLNTNLSTREIQAILDSQKKEQDSIAIVGITYDMMLSIQDEDMKTWLLTKQKENMDYILAQTQPNGVERTINFLDLLTNEIEKSKEERKAGEASG